MPRPLRIEFPGACCHDRMRRGLNDLKENLDIRRESTQQRNLTAWHSLEEVTAAVGRVYGAGPGKTCSAGTTVAAKGVRLSSTSPRHTAAGAIHWRNWGRLSGPSVWPLSVRSDPQWPRKWQPSRSSENA